MATRDFHTPAARAPRAISLNALIWVAPLTIVACVAANLLIRAVAVALAGVPSEFAQLRPPTIIVSTVIYLLLATGALLVVVWLSARPVRAYRILAAMCLLVSLLFPWAALSGVIAVPGMSVAIFWAIVAMHMTSAAISIALLPLAISRSVAAKLQ